LARIFKTRAETIPAGVPYLRPPPDVTAAWQQRLGAKQGLKVGVAWAGRPEHANDFRRSLDLSALAPIFSVAGVSFASLQIGPTTAALAARPEIADLSPHIEDFADTAGAIAALDLVIAVDTSVAHLAGALGKPVWVMLPQVNDWRWLLDRDDNPWYPTMRLFRPRDAEHWPDIIARTAAELAAVVGGDAARLTPFKQVGERRAAMAAEIIAAEDASVAASVVPQAERVSPGQALILADRVRRKGLLGDADALAQRAAAGEQSAEAAHMRSIIAYQSGKIAEAIEHLRHAIAIKPGVALYHTNLGEMYRLAGRVDEAVAEGRRALELDAERPTALNNLGIALFEQGKFDEALALYQRAIALQEDFVQAHSNSGNALQRLKRPAEAEKAYRRAIDLQPDFDTAWNNLGTCLRELHRPDEAEAAYRKSLELSPNSPDTLDNLALALRELERLDEAVDTFQRALSMEARNPQIHVHLASVYLDLDKVEECEAAIGRALALNPNNPDAINLQGRVAAERGELEAAIASFQGAIALKPDLADAYNNMGNALKHIGRLDDAKAAYFEALRIDPKDVGIHLNLADSLTFDPGNPYLAAMEALDQRRGELSKTQSTQLDFALGKAYADLKDYRRSFAYFLKANASKRSTVAYDEESALGLFDRIEAVFTPELIAAKSGSGDTSPMPIFVLGMPRSGTTLIEQIIASHPMVQGAGELRTLHEVVLKVLGPDRNTVPYPECAPALSASALRRIGESYIAAVRKVAPRGERVTDKMPSNYYFAGLIHLALPNAKIIHTIRDPIDTCVSCFSKLFASPQSHTYDLGELGRYYKRYERLMAHWRRVLPAGRILDVCYEDVVADLEGQARRIISYCELPWDDRCLSFHETTRPVHTASATQVRRPIYKTAVGRWRAYEEQLEPLLKALNIAEAALTT
jgi:tetratricopeptide (TPR) repeat protein